MQTLLFILNEQELTIIMNLLILTSLVAKTNHWGIQFSQHNLKYKTAADNLGGKNSDKL
jgi:hypothetical protein